jgi:hypothetical protein
MLAAIVSPVMAASSTIAKGTAVKAPAPAPVVHVDLPNASVTPTGTLDFGVNLQLTAAVPDLTLKTKVLTPAGAVLYQHTDTRSALTANTYEFEYSKALGPPAVREGRYRVQVQVKAGTAALVDVTADALVVDPGKHSPIPLAVVIRVAHVPATAPDGAFSVDPSSETTARAEVRAFARLAGSRRGLGLSLALSPLTLDEWSAASKGYRSVATSRSVSVSSDTSAALDCAATIDALASAVTSGSVPMIDVPYAEPDLSGLAGIAAVGDLRDQLDLSSNTYQTTLRSQPGTGTVLSLDGLPPETLPLLTQRNTGFVLVRTEALKRSGVATVTPGVYRLKDDTDTVTAIALDDRASGLLSDPTADPGHVAAAIYDRLDAKPTKGQPTVCVVDVGPGTSATAASLSAALDALAASGWVRLVSVADAAAMPPLADVSAAGPVAGGGAPPAGWWAGIAAARDSAAALADAVGSDDPDARRAAKDTLIAESGLWAGSDGSWSAAPRGRAFADEPVSIAKTLLGSLKVSASPVTLSGTSGKVPVNIHNGGDRILNVVLAASAPRVVVPDGGRVPATLRPGDNYVTVPVDMGSTFSAKLRVGVTAGPLEFSHTTVEVRASYVDRLALVALVVAVLVGLLFYIRSRTRSAAATTGRSRTSARDGRSRPPHRPRRRSE